MRVVPLHQITLTPLFSDYVYLFIALGVAWRCLTVPAPAGVGCGPEAGWRASRPWACSEPWDRLLPTRATPKVLQSDPGPQHPLGAGHRTGDPYRQLVIALFVPLLGWVGTF